MKLLNTTSPNNLALTIDGSSYTYEQLNSLTDAMCFNLSKLPKGVIVLSAVSSLQFIIQIIAAFKNQQPLMILSHQLSPEEKNQRMQCVNNALLIDSEGHLIKLLQHSKACENHSDTALILFTSGSQGQAKGVQLSYKNIKSNCQAIIQSLDFTSAKDQLLFLPLCYSFGLLGQLIPALMTGIHTYISNDFLAVNSILATGEIPQMWSGVPSHWMVLHLLFSTMPDAANKITHVISAGDKLAVPLRHQLHKQFPHATIYNNYGLTEASPRVLTLKSSDPDFFSNAVGYPIGEWQICLSDSKELLIKGPQVMLGYLGEKVSNRVEEGWLHTGDLAEVNTNHLVTIIGRTDRTINISGEKINLDYIETLLKQVITNVAVLSQDNVLHGQKLIIVIDKTVVQPRNQVIRLINKALPHWQHGFELIIMEQLPKNHRGKIDHQELNKILCTKDKND
jgi:long-chain acyl-CoA synthetase